MSFQKNPNNQKMGLSLQIVQKPTLLYCNENDDTEPGCDKCHKITDTGFFCPGGERAIVTKGELTPQERKTIEDHLYS